MEIILQFFLESSHFLTHKDLQLKWPLGLNRVEIEKDSLLLIDDSNPNGSSQILFNPIGNLE